MTDRRGGSCGGLTRLGLADISDSLS